MKRIALIVSFICLSVAAFAQAKTTDTLPAYLKHPELPAFNIRMKDSVTKFNTFNIKKGKYTMLFLFGAECTHCMHMTDSMINHMDELKDVQIYMFTFSPFNQMLHFADSFQLKKYKNITVGTDDQFFFPSFFKITSVPGIAIYDKQKKFVSIYNGNARIEDILNDVKEKK